MAQSCAFETVLDSTKAWLRTRGYIDENMTIKTTLHDFQSRVGNLTLLAEQKYEVNKGMLFTYNKVEVARPTGSPYYRTDDNFVTYKAVPNIDAFAAIERAKRASLPRERAANEVNYGLKIVEALSSDRAKEIFEKGKKHNWPLEKILTELQVPGQQRAIATKYNTTDRGQLLASIAADYSFTIEINTATNLHVPRDVAVPLADGRYEVMLIDADGEQFSAGIMTREEALADFGSSIFEDSERAAPVPTTHYGYLTVPGGTKYTENEIKTPNIVPVITGHAQFSTKNGIGWFRSDEQRSDDNSGKRVSDGAGGLVQVGQVGSRTRRVLEVQSDLFQKARSAQQLVEIAPHGKMKFTLNGSTYIKDYSNKPGAESYFKDGKQIAEEEYRLAKGMLLEGDNENAFLQLLNKDNNWVTFFVKSIIQDSVKKGYEKVLFPAGQTASKIEGQETLDEFTRSRKASIYRIDDQLRESEIEGYYQARLKDAEDALKAINKKTAGKRITDAPQDFYISPKAAGSKLDYSRIRKNLDGSMKLDLVGDPSYSGWVLQNYTVGYGIERNAEDITKITDEEAQRLLDLDRQYEQERLGQDRKNIEAQLKYVQDSKDELIRGRIESLRREKEQYQREIANAGAGVFSAIHSFYETTIYNVLKKQGYKPTRITDEFGNDWYEVELNQGHSNTIYFHLTAEQKTEKSVEYLAENQGTDKLSEKGREFRDKNKMGPYEGFLSFTKSTIPGKLVPFTLLDGTTISISTEDIEVLPEGEVDFSNPRNWVKFHVTAQGNRVGQIEVKAHPEGVAIALSGVWSPFSNKLATVNRSALDVIIAKIADFLHNTFIKPFGGKKRNVVDKSTNINLGKGIGPVMYDKLARYLKENYYSDLYSDTVRSKYAEALWSKFEREGKAEKDGGRYRYIISEEEPTPTTTSGPSVASVLARLQKIFPQIKVKYISEGDPNFIKGANAYIKNGVVYVQGNIDDLTMIEEFLHPFVATIYRTKPKLFIGLLNQALHYYPEIAAEVNRQYTEEKGFTNSDREQEIVTRALSHGLRNEFAVKPEVKTPKGFSKVIQRFLNWLANMLDKTFGDRFKPFKVYEEFIYSQITLKELAAMLNNGASYEVDLQGKEMFRLNKESEDLLAELQTIYNSDTELSKVVDGFFDTVENQIYRISGNKNYEQLKESLANPDGSSSYKDLKALLQDAKEKNGNVEEMRFKMRQIANSLSFVAKLSENMVKIAEKMGDDKTLDPREQIAKLRYMLQLTENWENFLQQFDENLESKNAHLKNVIGRARQNFATLKNVVHKTDKSGVLAILQDTLGNVREAIDELYNKEIAKLEAAIKKGGNVKSNQLLLKNRREEYKRFDLSKDNLLKYLTGEMGDTNMFSALFEAYISSPDPIVGGFAKFIKTNFYEVEATLQREKQKMLNELDKHMTDVDRSNPKELGEKLTFRDKILMYDDEGNPIAGETLTFLNPFKDYRFTMGMLEKNMRDAKERGDNAGYVTARQEFNRMRIAYMHNEYSPEYYRRQEIFNSTIGQVAKTKRDEILSDIRAKQLEISNKGVSDEADNIEMGLLWRKYRALHSSFDSVSGEQKTGDELAIAQLLQEYKKRSQEFYEWVPVKGAFERAKNIFSEELLAKGLDEGSQEYKDKMDAWEEDNTRTVVDEKFYSEVRQPILDIIETLSALLPGYATSANIGGKEVKAKKERMSEIWQKMFEQTGEFRDEDNQIDASSMTETKIRKTRELEELIEEIKEDYLKLSGLTYKQSERRSYLYNKSEHIGLEDYEEEELQALNDLAYARGLSKDQKTMFLNAIAQLQQIQTRKPSLYYLDALNELLQEHGKSVDASTALEYIQGNEFQDLTVKSPRLKKWFDDNHIMREYFDDQGEEQVEFKPLYVWTKVVPTDPKYYVKVPAMKYMKREVKKQYHNKKIVGETVDNKGEWLPRTDVPNSPFINAQYFQLLQSDPKTAKILEITTRYHLKTQEGLGRQHKLFLDVPRVRKSRLEGIREGDIKAKSQWLWNNLQAKFKRQADDYSEDYGNFNQEASNTNVKVVSTDMFGNEIAIAPIKYTAKIPLDQQTYDVIGAVLKYTQSSEMNKRLTQIHPLAQAFKSVLEKEGVKDTGKVSKFHKLKKKLDVFSNKHNENYTRLKAVTNLYEREFEGKENHMEIGEFGNKVAENMMHLAALTSLALDVPGSVKNLFTAQIQNLIQTVGKDFVNTGDWWRGNGMFLRDYMPALMSSNYKLGNKPIQVQMFQIFDPIQGDFGETFGRETSASMLKDAVGAKWAFATRKFGELEAQGSLFLGAMSRMTVEQTLPDGTKKAIRYADAFELDSEGVIKLKDGIDPEWAAGGKKFNDFKLKLHEINQRLQGNYAKFDRTEMERYTTGRLAVFLRKYLVPAFVNRYSPTRMNVGLGTVTEGYYQSFFKILNNLRKTGQLNWAGYTEQERRNFWKTVTELGISLTLGLLISLMGWDDDDEDKFDKLAENSWLYNHVLYQTMMWKSESEQFLPLPGMGINELQRIKNTPSIAFGQMDRYVVFANDLLFSEALQPFSDDDITHFQRKTGFWDKGDRKSVAHFARIFGFTGATIDSEAAIRNYYLMTTRTK